MIHAKFYNNGTPWFIVKLLGSAIEQILEEVKGDNLRESSKTDAKGDYDIGDLFDSLDLHYEVVRHGRSLFIESSDDPSRRTDAAKNILAAYEEFIKNISGIDDHGASLMGNAFRFIYKDTTIIRKPVIQVSQLRTENGRNLQEGLRFLSMGAMEAMRNRVMHSASKNNPLSIRETLQIFSTISFLWEKIDCGVTDTLAESNDFYEANDGAKSFKRIIEYYRKHNGNTDYLSSENKNRLFKSCIINQNIAGGYSSYPILKKYLEENSDFINSSVCELSEDDKNLLKKRFELV